MTLFNEDDLANVLDLVNLAMPLRRGPPLLTGLHSFHEGNRVVAVEVSLVDPRSCGGLLELTGGYRLSGLGTGAV
jgi:hypothetical protein